MNNLEHLIGAYFHQDWDLEHATREKAVAEFVCRSPQRAATVPREIDDLLASSSDEELVARLHAMGFDDAPPDGDRSFLDDVRADLARLLGRSVVTGELVPPTVTEDLEETFDAEGILPLYQVGWSMSGSVPRGDDRFDAMCRGAFDAFRARHPGLQLVWTQWPTDLADARPASPGTAIDLDLDPEAPVDTPMLVLVDPEDLPG